MTNCNKILQNCDLTGFQRRDRILDRNNRKGNSGMKKTFAVALCIVLAAFFYGCGHNESSQETTNPSSSVGQSSSAQEQVQQSNAATQTPTQGTQPQQPAVSDTQPDAQPSATEQEQTNGMENTTDLTGSWAPAFGESVASGTAANLQEIYGSGYAYGGSLDLNTDGTFSVSVGIVKDDDAHQGTYRIDGNLVYVSYNNGEEDVFEYLSDYNGGEAIKARQGDYYIYFCR